MGVKVAVWGDRALFTRPEMKVERSSYDVITASAARGILDAIYWHKGMRWVIDRVHVLKPIRFQTLMRNEVAVKMPHQTAIQKANDPSQSFSLNTREQRQLRRSQILLDVHYVIEAHFELTEEADRPAEDAAKFAAIFDRRLRKGQCYHRPYLGTREFAAHFAPWEDEEIPAIDENRELGLMLLDMDYRDRECVRPVFANAVMKEGVVEYPDPVKWLEQGGGEVIL